MHFFAQELCSNIGFVGEVSACDVCLGGLGFVTEGKQTSQIQRDLLHRQPSYSSSVLQNMPWNSFMLGCFSTVCLSREWRDATDG